MTGAAIYDDRKSTEENGVADEPRSLARQVAHKGAALVLLLVFLVTFGCTSERQVVLRCDYGDNLKDVYELDQRAKTVRLLSVNPPRPGSLVVSDSIYHLEFPENHPAAGYLLLKVDINRFTAKAEREIGRERKEKYQGQLLELHAVRDSGKCVPVMAGEVL